MVLTQTKKLSETTNAFNEAMNVLLTKLDAAINDMENGKVQTVEEVWSEIDEI